MTGPFISVRITPFYNIFVLIKYCTLEACSTEVNSLNVESVESPCLKIIIKISGDMCSISVCKHHLVLLIMWKVQTDLLDKVCVFKYCQVFSHNNNNK